MSSKQRFSSDEVEKLSTVELIAELKRRYQVLSRPERSCVLNGPHCSGVATQASFLRKQWGLCSISREDIMKTDLEKGMLKLSEELSSFRCRRGFVLSHFPNNIEEATSLDEMLKEKHTKWANYKVLLLSMSAERDDSLKELTERAKGHLVHPASERSYNTNVPELAPQTPFVDDITGEPLVSRQWSIPKLTDSINKWWDVDLPSIDEYYGKRAIHIAADQSIDSVALQISKILLNNGQESEKI